MKGDIYDNGFLRGGHFLMLKFDSGYLTLQILTHEFLELKPYILLNGNDVREAIPAQSAGNDNDLVVDEQANEILEPTDNERGVVAQLQFGVAPSRMQVFPIFGRDRNIGSGQNDAEPGEDLLWFNGHDSPYNNPAEQSEVIYLNDMSPLKLQAYNPMDEAQEARISVHINRLRYAVVTDKGMIKSMLQGQIPAKKHSVGLGARDRDQLEAPDWVSTNFGEHLYTINEILDFDKDDSDETDSPDVPGSTFVGE